MRVGFFRVTAEAQQELQIYSFKPTLLLTIAAVSRVDWEGVPVVAQWVTTTMTSIHEDVGSIPSLTQLG